jgi:hypothetical protein
VITAWILLSPVLADTGSDTASNVSCSPPSLDDHRPLDGQLDVPVDAALMLAFRTTDVDGEVCFQAIQAIQEDEAGRGGDASDTACEQLPGVSLSCSSASTRPASMALLLLPLLAAGCRRC